MWVLIDHVSEIVNANGENVVAWVDWGNVQSFSAIKLVGRDEKTDERNKKHGKGERNPSQDHNQSRCPAFPGVCVRCAVDTC